MSIGEGWTIYDTNSRILFVSLRQAWLFNFATRKPRVKCFQDSSFSGDQMSVQITCAHVQSYLWDRWQRCDFSSAAKWASKQHVHISSVHNSNFVCYTLAPLASKLGASRIVRACERMSLQPFGGRWETVHDRPSYRWRADCFVALTLMYTTN